MSWRIHLSDWKRHWLWWHESMFGKILKWKKIYTTSIEKLFLQSRLIKHQFLFSEALDHWWLWFRSDLVIWDVGTFGVLVWLLGWLDRSDLLRIHRLHCPMGSSNLRGLGVVLGSGPVFAERCIRTSNWKVFCLVWAAPSTLPRMLSLKSNGTHDFKTVSYCLSVCIITW